MNITKALDMNPWLNKTGLGFESECEHGRNENKSCTDIFKVRISCVKLCSDNISG